MFEQCIAQENQKAKKSRIDKHVPTGKAVAIELLDNIHQGCSRARPVYGDLDQLTQPSTATGSHKGHNSFPTQPDPKQQEGDGGNQDEHLRRISEITHRPHEISEPYSVNGLDRVGYA